MGLISRVSSRTYRNNYLKKNLNFSKMPRSKRNKMVSLTKTEKKNSGEHKSSKIEEIRDALREYKYFYTYTTDNTRNAVLKQLRLDWRDDSRFFETKRRLIQV